MCAYRRIGYCILAFSCLSIWMISSSSCIEEPEKPVFYLDTLSNEMAVDLNRLTYTIADAHDHFYSFIGVRALATTHLAMHDLLNRVDPHYTLYAYTSPDSTYNAVAAAAEATKQILLETYPKRADTINAVCNTWINTVSDGSEKEAGVKAGKEAAKFYISLRKDDGHEKQGVYTPMTKPGDYQYTGKDAWVWKPDFSVARPFTLDSLNQFRSDPPPDITGAAYAKDYNEVKAYGGKNSTERSEDQTNYAHWWAEFGEHGWNRIGRITAEEQDLSLIDANRMFALINVNLYDLYLASFESKYQYDTWRPVTAIHAAADDGNPDTEPDPSWEPEMETPPWPEYPSTHAAVGAGGAEILTHVYGTAEVPFTMESVTALPRAPKRQYKDLDKAADDCADSRVMNGYHFRFATEAGKVQGRAIARHVVGTILTPLEEE